MSPGSTSAQPVDGTFREALTRALSRSPGLQLCGSTVGAVDGFKVGTGKVQYVLGVVGSLLSSITGRCPSWLSLVCPLVDGVPSAAGSVGFYATCVSPCCRGKEDMMLCRVLVDGGKSRKGCSR